jgi:hypothetical protein
MSFQVSQHRTSLWIPTRLRGRQAFLYSEPSPYRGENMPEYQNLIEKQLRHSADHSDLNGLVSLFLHRT